MAEETANTKEYISLVYACSVLRAMIEAELQIREDIEDNSKIIFSDF